MQSSVVWSAGIGERDGSFTWMTPGRVVLSRVEHSRKSEDAGGPASQSPPGYFVTSDTSSRCPALALRQAGPGRFAHRHCCCAARANAGLQLAISTAAAIVQSIAWGGSCGVMSGWEAEAMARSDSARGLGWIYAEGEPSPWRGRFFSRSSVQPAVAIRGLRSVAVALSLRHGRHSPQARALTQERPA